jgi:hypothetical protein
MLLMRRPLTLLTEMTLLIKRAVRCKRALEQDIEVRS